MDKSAEEKRGFFRGSFPVRITHVDTVQAKFLRVPIAPLEIIHERPGVISFDREAILEDSLQNLVGVVFVIVNPAVAKFLSYRSCQG